MILDVYFFLIACLFVYKYICKCQVPIKVFFKHLSVPLRIKQIENKLNSDEDQLRTEDLKDLVKLEIEDEVDSC